MSKSALHLFAGPPGEEALASLPEEDLVVWLEPQLGGAWTEYRQGREVIRFGFPQDSKNRWFRIFEVPRKGHNVLSQALERMLFAREIGVLNISGPEPLWQVARRGAEKHPSVAVHMSPAEDAAS